MSFFEKYFIAASLNKAAAARSNPTYLVKWFFVIIQCFLRTIFFSIQKLVNRAFFFFLVARNACCIFVYFFPAVPIRRFGVPNIAFY